jgi:hypothetical protein
LILSAVVCRAFLESYTDEPYKRETVDDIHEWFDELDLWPQVEPDECEIVRAPFGKMSKWSQVRGTWYVEGLAILAWALQRGEFPAHHEQVDPIAVTNALNFLDPDAEQLLRSPNLRELAELQAAREWFYDVHCKVRGFLNRGTESHVSDWIGEQLTILKIDPTTVIREGNLTVAGKLLRDTNREWLEDWESVICERHRAAIWLVGEDPLYTEISVAT